MNIPFSSFNHLKDLFIITKECSNDLYIINANSHNSIALSLLYFVFCNRQNYIK